MCYLDIFCFGLTKSKGFRGGFPTCLFVEISKICIFSAIMDKIKDSRLLLLLLLSHICIAHYIIIKLLYTNIYSQHNYKTYLQWIRR